MLRKVRLMIESIAVPAANKTPDQAADMKLAAAVLLVEVMMADHHIDPAEKAGLFDSIRILLDIDAEEARDLINQAQDKHDELVSLYDVTSVINQNYQPAQKLALLEHMWRIAYADRQWDKYEEHLIRKMADLLYISHKDFIIARNKAAEAATGV